MRREKGVAGREGKVEMEGGMGGKGCQFNTHTHTHTQ